MNNLKPVNWTAEIDHKDEGCVITDETERQVKKITEQSKDLLSKYRDKEIKPMDGNKDNLNQVIEAKLPV